MHRELLTPDSTSSVTLIVLNKRELATANAMLRMVGNLIWYGYPRAADLYTEVSVLLRLCGPDARDNTMADLYEGQGRIAGQWPDESAPAGEETAS